MTFGASLVRFCCGRSSCLPPLADPTGRLKVLPADGDFYARASDGLVTLPAAEYDYGGNWAISTGGSLTRWNSS